MSKKACIRESMLLVFFFILYSGKISAQDCNTDKTNGISAANVTATNQALAASNAFDNLRSTFWYSTAATASVRVDLTTPIVITTYSITSGPASGTLTNTSDPKDFVFEGSADGASFTALDTRSGETFATRNETKYYSFTNNNAYRFYRLRVTANNGATTLYVGEMQLMPGSDCIVGNVTNSISGNGYAAVPVTIRTAVGTYASTVTDVAGHFAFTNSNAPGTDYALLITPPPGTYLYADPVANWNASVTNTSVLNLIQQGHWPKGAYLNVYGDGLNVTGTPYMIDNTEGSKTPSSFDWVIKPSPIQGSLCTVIPTTLDGGGTFGTISTTEYIQNHPWQPGFHSGVVPVTGEAHPNLFRQLTSAASGYSYGGLIYNNRGALYDEGKYCVTSFSGTVQDASYFFSRTFALNTSYNVLNGYTGGWRKTYGRTTGDPYDLFLAANGQTTATGSILEFSANIGTTGVKYLNFYGKNANAYIQGIATSAEVVFSVYDASNTLVATSTLFLSPSASLAQDDPASPWEGRTFSFNVPSPGTYTFKVSVPTTAQMGNDFYLDQLVLTECPIQYNLTGTVWNDMNGSVTINAGENGTDTGNPLYVNLVDNNGFILTTVKVNADGTYTMPIPAEVSGYKLVLTTNPSTTTPSLPSGWVNTGDNVDPGNTAVQGSVKGVIELNTGTSDISGQNFGIEQPPVADNKLQQVPYPTNGNVSAGQINQNVTGTDPVYGTSGIALNNSNTIVITAPPSNATMWYDYDGAGGNPPVQITAGTQITGFNPANLSYTGIAAGSVSVTFNYAFIDAAGVTGSTATYTIIWTGGPLPIKLEYFVVKEKECNRILLEWKVSSALNFSHFEVERSVTGEQFKTVYKIQYSDYHSEYQITDDPEPGRYQYRLKMIDEDGRYEYGSVVSVVIDCDRNIKMYPTKTTASTTITGLKAKQIIRFVSSTGQVIKSITAGSSIEWIDISKLNSGLYFVVIKDESDYRVIYQGKLIKQ